jgi:hypothetical protein
VASLSSAIAHPAAPGESPGTPAWVITIFVRPPMSSSSTRTSVVMGCPSGMPISEGDNVGRCSHRWGKGAIERRGLSRAAAVAGISAFDFDGRSLGSVSFDLYFLSREQHQSWDDALAALEDSANDERPLAEADLALWRRLEAKVREVLPASEVFEGQRNRELSDEGSGIQVSFFPGELSLTVPYWHSGPEAERLIDILRRVASILEEESGLTAYDPQAEAPFLEGGAAAAATSFDMVHESLHERGITAGQGTVPSPKPKSRWRKLLGG